MAALRHPCVFWNVQRLFEPERDGPVASTLGVTRANWTPADYERKIANLAQCLSMVTGGKEPALIGFAEVETLRVVQDIIRATGWTNLVSVDEPIPSPELSGLDVALVYNTKVFEDVPIRAMSLTLNNLFDTRDLLQVGLRLRDSGAEVEVFVVHWPSRVMSEGRVLRLAHSYYLKGLIRSVIRFTKSDILNSSGVAEMPPASELLTRWNTPCVVIGDFNDEPYDESIREALGTTRLSGTAMSGSELKGLKLIEPDNYLAAKFWLFNPCWNLTFSDTGQLGGTYYRSPEWRLYDQVLVSHGLIVSDTPPVRLADASVVVPRLATFSGTSGEVEMATRNGIPLPFSRDKPEGVSDHFPLLFSIDVD